MTQFIRQLAGYLNTKFLQVTQPAASITDPTRRQQIRLLNSLVLVFVPIALVGGLTHLILVPNDMPILNDSAIIMVILSAVLLTVTAWFGKYVGYWGATALVFITGYAIILLNASYDLPDYFDLTYFLLLSVLGTILFKLRVLVLIAFIEVVTVILFSQFYARSDSVNIVIFLVVANLVLLVTSYYRNLLESDRLLKLRESDTLMRLITDQLPMSVWITDEKLHRRATFGRTQHIKQVDTIPSNKAIKAYRDALAGKSAQFENEADERFLRYHIEPLQDEDGKTIGTLGVATDITEQKVAEQQGLQLRLERERVELLSKFIEHSSHDLRTPLSNINTYLYLLNQSVNTDKQREYIRVVQEQSKRLQGLINNMLTLQRLEMATDYSFSYGSLKSLLDEIHTFYQDRLERHQLRFEYVPPARNLLLFMDHQQIFNALTKIIDNAIQFTAGGGTIRLSVEQGAEDVLISIQDTGIGIRDEQLPHIFDIFYRGDDSRPATSGDNGTGLTIAQRIVHVHRGDITVESQVDIGTTFRISLPLSSAKQSVQA